MPPGLIPMTTYEQDKQMVETMEEEEGSFVTESNETGGRRAKIKGDEKERQRHRTRKSKAKSRVAAADRYPFMKSREWGQKGAAPRGGRDPGGT